MGIFHGRNLAVDLIEQEEEVTSRTKTYKLVEHLNAAVNLARSMKNYPLADKIKECIRNLNAQTSEATK